MRRLFPRPVHPAIRLLLLGTVLLSSPVLRAPPHLSAQQNPFFSGGSEEGSEERSEESPVAESPSPGQDNSADTGEPGRRRPANPLGRLGNRGVTRIARIQRRLYEGITGTVESLSRDPSFIVVFSLFGIMFLYGFLHAVGPGHRKVVLTSYFLSESIRTFPGILMAGGVALLHGVSAIVLIGALYFALDLTIGGSFNSASLIIERISYGILILLGVYLIIHTIREGRRHETNAPVSSEPRGRKRLAGKIVFVLTNGIVPCPGAAMVLVFTFTYGLYTLGVFSVIAMSIGMGVLLSLVAAVVIVGKEKGLRRILAGKRGRTAMRVLEIAGGCAVGLFGLILLLGSL